MTVCRECRDECARAVRTDEFYRDESGEKAAAIIMALPTRAAEEGERAGLIERIGHDEDCAHWMRDTHGHECNCSAPDKADAILAAGYRRAPAVTHPELMAALAPFSESAHNYADCADEERFVDNDATITVRHLREARAALTAASRGHEK